MFLFNFIINLQAKNNSQILLTPPPMPGPNLFLLEVKLLHTAPTVWRLLELSPGTNLLELHAVIQVAMNWRSSHLFQFEVMRNGKKELYGCPDFDIDEDELLLDAKKVKLTDFLLAEGDSIRYVYDLGDFWEHEVILRGYARTDSTWRYPRCLAGAMACPPEDVGGPFGYSTLKEAILSKKKAEIREYDQWLGYRFDAYEYKNYYWMGMSTNVKRIMKLYGEEGKRKV